MEKNKVSLSTKTSEKKTIVLTNEDKVQSENTSYFSNVLLSKDKLIQDLKNCNFQTQSEFHALMSRLDSVEKENAFLRYEHRALEKELHLRHDELGFTHKQNLEIVNKLNKLQAECLRLHGKKRGHLLEFDRVKELKEENNMLKECLFKKEEEISCLLKVRDSCLYLTAPDEINHFRTLNSDMSLMDDFVEMEKLAIVAIDTPSSFADDGVDPLSDFSKALVPFGLNEEYEEKAKDSSSTVRDEFRKYLGGDGPGTAMELESVQKLMIEMEKICSNFHVEIKELKNGVSFIKIQQSEENILSLQNEIEILKEMNRTNEEQVENQKLINEELETQLGVNKAKINELLQKVSTLEVEMDNKSQSCQELEETCIELRLQIESNRYSESNEVALDNKKFKKQPTLLDQMLSDDAEKVKPIQFSKSKEFPDGEGTNHKVYHEALDSMARALAIVPTHPSKSKGKMGFLRKLILRKKKPSSKNTTIYYCK